MRMTALVPCASCHRHIRVDHAECPFCSASVPADFARRVVPGARGRLDRLATFTFAATAASALGIAGCGEVLGGDPGSVNAMYGLAQIDDAGAGEGDASGGDVDGGGGIAMYGLPRVEDAAAPDDDGSVHAMYGIPHPESDASVPPTDDASVNDDAGQSHDAGAVPAYGLPHP